MWIEKNLQFRLGSLKNEEALLWIERVLYTKVWYNLFLSSNPLNTIIGWAIFVFGMVSGLKLLLKTILYQQEFCSRQRRGKKARWKRKNTLDGRKVVSLVHQKYLLKKSGQPTLKLTPQEVEKTHIFSLGSFPLLQMVWVCVLEEPHHLVIDAWTR